jgi:Domain of unknown function (DUF4190)
MRAFCPNCGTENEATAGGRVTCLACTTSFEVSRGTVEPTNASATPQAEQPFPNVVTRLPVVPEPKIGALAPLNPLAVASVVAGVLCCVPFSAFAAIGLGFAANAQIAASNGLSRGRELALAGIALGGLSLVISVLIILGLALNAH